MLAPVSHGTVTMKNRGFTLVEISVVMTIVALLIGGVLLGQSLIRSSQLNSIVTDRQLYTTAINDFRSKYLAMPGDFGGLITSTTTGAAALWGSAATTAANCRTVAGSRTSASTVATCNGDGDGIIDEYNDASYNYEQFRAWEHLNNAGFTSVKVNGLMTATFNKTPGTNVPTAKLSGAGWAITFLSQSIASTQAIVTTGDTPFKHVLWFGGISPSGVATNQTTPVLRADEALSLDQKIDDGYANTGEMVAQTNASGTACVSSSQYAATTGGNICSLVFKTGL